jgi:hypothetical protein
MNQMRERLSHRYRPQNAAISTTVKTRRSHMLRKIILALATTATLGAAALAPTSASAHWGGGWGGWHGGWRFHPFVRVYAGPVYDGCEVRRWVYTPYGWIHRCY